MSTVKENKTEARQAEPRRMNRFALVWGLGLAIVALALIWLFFAGTTGM
jgi:hypothetical protein